jgi:hypothetical protein
MSKRILVVPNAHRWPRREGAAEVESRIGHKRTRVIAHALEQSGRAVR